METVLWTLHLLDLLWWLLLLPLSLHQFASSALGSVPCQRSLAPGDDYPSSKERDLWRLRLGLSLGEGDNQLNAAKRR